VAALLIGLAVIGWGGAHAQPRAADAQASLALVADAGPDAREGAILYAYHCAACHGDTGRGFAEARSVFPPTHRSCTRCHRPANPPTMPADAIRANDVFDIGRAPSLLGEETALDRFGGPAALRAYVAATMPRPFPASLTDAEYDRIVAFLVAAAEPASVTADADVPPTQSAP
jgi:mono/diheme cytochrome c family protein